MRTPSRDASRTPSAAHSRAGLRVRSMTCHAWTSRSTRRPSSAAGPRPTAHDWPRAHAPYSRAASWLVGQAILDSQSGFRLVRFDALRHVRLRARRYEFEMEVLIKLCARGATVAHAAVTTVYDRGQARSKMNPVRDTIRICLWSLVFRFGRG